MASPQRPGMAARLNRPRGRWFELYAGWSWSFLTFPRSELRLPGRNLKRPALQPISLPVPRTALVEKQFICNHMNQATICRN